MASIEGEQLRVLVGFETSGGVRNRPLTFSSSREALVTFIQERFADLLPSPSGDVTDLVIPPSTVLKKAFNELMHYPPSEVE